MRAQCRPLVNAIHPGLGMLYRRVSTLDQVTIASIAGCVRGAGGELILACDLRFPLP
jgi:enoyl-CoA hydratase/carnithine racemase